MEYAHVPKDSQLMLIATYTVYVCVCVFMLSDTVIKLVKKKCMHLQQCNKYRGKNAHERFQLKCVSTKVMKYGKMCNESVCLCVCVCEYVLYGVTVVHNQRQLASSCWCISPSKFSIFRTHTKIQLKFFSVKSF